MRKKSNTKAYLIFAMVILCFLSIPISQSIGFKGFIFDLISPFFSWIPPKKSPPHEHISKIEQLRLESRELALENRHLKAILKEQELGLIKINDTHTRRPFGNAISAKVLYRSPLFWSNFFMIDVGHNANTQGENPIISKGSPVIFYGALIGVVDYVGKKMSRVKLITDEGLQPSVRVARGYAEENELLSLINRLILSLESRGEIDLIGKLKIFYENLKKDSDSLYLAKGVLQGKSQPLWRSSHAELKGFGFNYDFSDDHGPARDLLTGKVDNNHKESTLSLIESGDLLVTSGLDGVFPEGLPVAVVKKVDKLKEGDFCFGIRALPCVDNLNNLSDVFVLPSLSFHEENFIQMR